MSASALSKTKQTWYDPLLNVLIPYQAVSYGSDLSGALLWQYAHVYVTTNIVWRLMAIQHALF